MKIGIEVQRLFRKKKFGIETSSLELIKTLREVEPQHEYVIFVKDDEDRNCLTPSGNLKIKAIGGRIFVDFEQLFLPLAAKREQVDILHCTGNTAPYFSTVPIIQTLHDVIFMDAIPNRDSFYQRFGNHYRRKVVPLVTPRSRAVVTVSQYEKERIIQRLGINSDKVHVVYNGLNEKRFHQNITAEQKQIVKEKYHLPDEFILFLGNQTTRKNPLRAIEAYVKYVSECRKPFALVTPGLSKNFIVRKLRQLSFPYSSEMFITPGYIADEDLPALYALSKIFLFPSLSEGFGMPMIEAMACGTPVIASNATSLPEIAGNAAVLADPLKAAEIASCITNLVEKEDLLKNKREAGFINARRFSWKQSAETLLQLYEAVYIEATSPAKEPRFVNKHAFVTRD